MKSEIKNEKITVKYYRDTKDDGYFPLRPPIPPVEIIVIHFRLLSARVQRRRLEAYITCPHSSVFGNSANNSS